MKQYLLRSRSTPGGHGRVAPGQFVHPTEQASICHCGTVFVTDFLRRGWHIGPRVLSFYLAIGLRGIPQIIGFDLLLDKSLRPWLLEVNHNPSFTCDTEFDRTLKGGVVRSTLKLLQACHFASYKHAVAGSATFLG